MKKIILGIALVVLIVFGISSQSWAMGRRAGGSGHSNHHSGSSSRNQSNVDNNSSSEGQGSFYETFNHAQDNEENTGSHNGSESEENGFVPETHGKTDSGDDRFPAATPVPEPATVSLVGMGLASLLLARRKQ